MTTNTVNEGNITLIEQILQWIVEVGIDGGGLLGSAKQVAEDHLSKTANVEDAINSVISWRTAHAAGTGFVTGLGGIAAMPITIPAGLAVCYALGANTAAAVAYLRGYDIQSDQVRTVIFLCLIGDAGEEILKNAGITVGTKVCQNLIKKIPGKVLIEVNKKIGFRLITKTGEKGAVNLMKMVPLVGGVVGGTFDGTYVNICGQTAKKRFFLKRSTLASSSSWIKWLGCLLCLISLLLIQSKL